MNLFMKIMKLILFKADMPDMKEYEIKMNMVNDDVVRMDMASFKKSAEVRKQAIAAKKSIRHANI